MKMPRIFFLNAALNGAQGNTAVLLEQAGRYLSGRALVSSHVLAENPAYQAVRKKLVAADAIVIGTGTHWDSWSSHLQRFLEEATPDEGTSLWLGKPAGVVVTMHSVGGKEVLSRLQGVLSTLGCLIPPMSGMVYSLLNQNTVSSESPGVEDVWCADDLEVICENLLQARNSRPRYRAWPVDRKDFSARWIHKPNTPR